MKRTLLALLALATVVSFAEPTPADLKRQEKQEADCKAPVLFIGDSMMRLLGIEAEKSFRKAGIEPTVAFSSLGSGLVRPLVFDWMAKIDELIATNHPATVFIALGANDRQALEAEAGGIVPYGTPEWPVEYSKRLAAVMDKFIAAGAERVVWLLLPDMKETSNQEHAMLANELTAIEAAKDEHTKVVRLFEMNKAFNHKPGRKYSPYMMSPTGQSLCVRDPDGVHLSAEGCKVMTKAILKTYFGK